jgi:alpha-L-fucosidase 2
MMKMISQSKAKILLRNLSVSVILFTFSFKGFSQSTDILWYKLPARYFEESLVLGNGKMGASVFGGMESDKIYLNDATLWSGEPVDPYMNPEAYKNLPAVREALNNENYQLADELQHKMQGKFSQSYMPLGTLFIDFKYNGEPRNYYRELDISNAVSKVSFEVAGVFYTREYFISYPDQVMVIRLTSSKKGALNFAVRFKSQLKYKWVISGNEFFATGYAPTAAKPNYLGDVADAVVFDKDRGTRFSSLIEIRNSDGNSFITDSSSGLQNASSATILVSVATSFNGYKRNPATQGLDHEAIARKQVKAAASKSYEDLKKAHLADYQKYFKRVKLDLGTTTATNLPTDERLERYATGQEDKNLEILYFQYGRYLLISSSRTPGVPANLQGIWNPYIRPPWSSNYTTNINAEENYWLAENTNLSEMHMPMLTFVKNVAETGKVTAKTFLGTDGWVACHNSDIWAMSNPVGDFGHGDPVWANWYMGGAWLSTGLWEHYLFTQDKEWLKNEGYDLMRGAAVFCLNWLVEKNGELITSPSTSPENRYINSDGYHGSTLYGGTADLAMVRACMQQTVAASALLNTDAELREKLQDALKRLHPFMIGKKGNLQEWYYDWEDDEPQHRHQSHLFGLFPGHQITPVTTPELANACRKTLEIKGDETTGWSKGWRINLWARLYDGNHAYKMYRELLKYVPPDGMRTNYSGGGGTYPNLFDAHPPFQIDGNFGGSAAVAEMLLQSDGNEIRLLPALPDAWEKGSVSGLCARGGFEVSIVWENHKAISAEIISKTDTRCRIIAGDIVKEADLKAGKTFYMVFAYAEIPH